LKNKEDEIERKSAKNFLTRTGNKLSQQHEKDHYEEQTTIIGWLNQVDNGIFDIDP
jgi:hypothetical protein